MGTEIKYCANCGRKIRFTYLEKNSKRKYCSRTCRALVQGKAREVAVPNRTLSQIKAINKYTGMVPMDIIVTAINNYYKKRVR